MVDRSHSCNREGPRAVLLAVQAGDTSPNVAVAEHLLHFDCRWNPAIENSAPIVCCESTGRISAKELPTKRGGSCRVGLSSIGKKYLLN